MFGGWRRAVVVASASGGSDSGRSVNFGLGPCRDSGRSRRHGESPGRWEAGRTISRSSANRYGCEPDPHILNESAQAVAI